MHDAIGGVVNITIIIVFLVIVSGYLAFNLNYTKAFRVKNNIITTIERYEGNCESDDGACALEIKKYMTDLGYNAPENLNLSEYDRCRTGYCYKKVNAVDNDDPSIVGDIDNKVYYKVVTVIYIDIPIINKIMPHLKVFQVTGTTKAIEAEPAR